MLLKQLLSYIEYEDCINVDENIVIDQIDYNSKNVVKNSLFVAIKGYKTDGHRFISDAVKNGAVALIVNEFNKALNIPQIKVKNARSTLSKLSAAIENYPSNKLKVVGITATNGKTTTTMMLDSILNKNNFKTALLGTVVNKVGDEIEKSVLTTPESKELQALFHKMVRKQVDVCTMEVSSAAQELKRVQDVDFDIVIMNNISKEHMEQHGSFENYFFHKKKLVTQAKKDAVVILNKDDNLVCELATQTEAQVFTYSIVDSSATVFCEKYDIQNATFTLVINEKIGNCNPQKVDFKLKTGGLHSITNAISAIIAALVLNVDVEIIKSGIFEFSGVERRFQLIYDETFKVYDDHFANEGNVSATLKSISLMKYQQLIFVWAIRGNRGSEINFDVLNTMLKWKHALNINHFIVTSYTDFDIKNNVVSDQEKQFVFEFLTQNNISFTYKDKLHDAIALAIDVTKTNDLVVLAGCQGMDNGARLLCDILKSRNIIDETHLLNKIVDSRVAGE